MEERMEEPIVKPIIDDLKKTHLPKPATPLGKEPIPAESDQDAGGGYNPNGTYPQT